MTCSCPDWATMCKHVAAVLYGVGARLDQAPELLFTLRQVDQTELLTRATSGAVSRAGTVTVKRIAAHKLADVFGIDIDDAPSTPATPVRKKQKPRAPAGRSRRAPRAAGRPSRTPSSARRPPGAR